MTSIAPTSESEGREAKAPRDVARPKRHQRLETLAPVLLQLVARGLSLLPLSVAHALALVVANTQWLLGVRAARTTQGNIERCFPELSARSRRKLARQSLIETAKTFAEMGLVWHGTPRRAARLVQSVEGIAHVEAAPGAVLVLMPHFGNWELLGHVFGSGPGLTCLYAPPKIKSLESLVCRARTRWGVCMAPTTRRGLKQFYAVARDHGIVGLLPDQTPPPSAAVDAPFFGQDVLTMVLAHRLIMRVRPRVVLAWVERTRRGFAAHIEPLHGDVYSPDAATSAAAMNAAIEQVVRRNPAQYQWEYKRFRRRRNRSARSSGHGE
ncbi:MAG: lipid A biosynthesis acyltransferase [Gammaproteobacteria bacterium]|nr:lipid A biosynthesis acyltransferase [Gammaproteobacteria bacterium]